VGVAFSGILLWATYNSKLDVFSHNRSVSYELLTIQFRCLLLASRFISMQSVMLFMLFLLLLLFLVPTEVPQTLKAIEYATSL